MHRKGGRVEENWLIWSRKLKAISQIGLSYTKDPYDRERYEQIAEIALEMLSDSSGMQQNEIRKVYLNDTGYATPKVDLRAAAFKGDRILLVRERSDGCWTLPGGWADVNESPREGIIREVHEESGFRVDTEKLVALFDRSKHPHKPHYPHHLYKLFFLCRIVGGGFRKNVETLAADFFSRNSLPELSIARVLPEQIDLMFEHHKNVHLPTVYD